IKAMTLPGAACGPDVGPSHAVTSSRARLVRFSASARESADGAADATGMVPNRISMISAGADRRARRASGRGGLVRMRSSGAAQGFDIDEIDLRRRKEHLRIATVDAGREEQVEELGVDVVLVAHLRHDGERFRKRLGFFIGTVAGGQGFED